MNALLNYVNFWDRPKYASLVGFFSVYAIWALPAFFWGWNQWVSYAYSFGDHIVLPVFNSLSFWLLSKRKRKIPLWSVLLVIAAGLAVSLLDPDASSISDSLEDGAFTWDIDKYHNIFIFLELSFIFFMVGVYPFLRDVAYAPIKLMLPLFLLITCFLAFTIIPDDALNGFPFWKKVTPPILLWTIFIVYVLDVRFGAVHNNRVRFFDFVRDKFIVRRNK